MCACFFLFSIVVQDKCQVSKNYKKSFLRYIENTTGSVRNFAKCMHVLFILCKTRVKINFMFCSTKQNNWEGLEHSHMLLFQFFLVAVNLLGKEIKEPCSLRLNLMAWKAS